MNVGEFIKRFVTYWNVFSDKKKEGGSVFQKIKLIVKKCSIISYSKIQNENKKT